MAEINIKAERAFESLSKEGYRVLALAEGATLVTADVQQREVAEAAGVEVHWIDPAAG